MCCCGRPQTDPGLIGSSSGLLHIHISRVVIIVCYRLDQFAFNPDFRTKEDCGASRRQRQIGDRKPSFCLQCATKQTSPLSEAQHSHKSLESSLTDPDKGGSSEDVKTPRGTPRPLGHLVLPHRGGFSFPGSLGVWSMKPETQVNWTVSLLPVQL